MGGHQQYLQEFQGKFFHQTLEGRIFGGGLFNFKNLPD